jgi:plasmid stabilization system protein ParE
VRFLLATATAIVLLGIAVAGCGGGGSSTGSSSAPGTNASSGGDDVSAAANEACAEANKRIAALGTPDNNQAVLEYLEQTEQAVDQLQVEVAGLNGPAAMADYADALATSVGVLAEMSNAARSRNPDAVRELSKELETLKVGKLAEAAGLDTCAETPGVES